MPKKSLMNGTKPRADSGAQFQRRVANAPTRRVPILTCLRAVSFGGGSRQSWSKADQLSTINCFNEDHSPARFLRIQETLKPRRGLRPNEMMSSRKVLSYFFLLTSDFPAPSSFLLETRSLPHTRSLLPSRL